MCTAEHDDKEQAILLVLEKQVLGVPARQLALQFGAFRNSENGWVLHGLGADAERGQAGEQVLSGSGHAAGTLGHYGFMPSYPSRLCPRNPLRSATPSGRPNRRSAAGLPGPDGAAPVLANSAPLLHKTALTTMDAGVAQG